MLVYVIGKQQKRQNKTRRRNKQRDAAYSHAGYKSMSKKVHYQIKCAKDCHCFKKRQYFARDQIPGAEP
jgi:hypothetical protein